MRGLARLKPRSARVALKSTQSAAKPVPLATLHEALEKERARAGLAENDQFLADREASLKQAVSASRYPRTLANRTFFTPHGTHRNAPPAKRDPIEREYAVLLPDGRASAFMYDPSQHHLSQLPSNTPSEIQSAVIRMERQGFRFIGVNRNLYVLEREVNRWTWAQQRVWKYIGRMGTGVVGLTALIYAGEIILAARTESDQF